METFKSLWRPRGTIAIPEYTYEDGVDLEVKALLYIYKRLAIPRTTDRLDLVAVPEISADDLAQLDRMYNVPRFLKVVMQTDPHRVLVDWPKNRFRAMLILPHMPQMEHLPRFPEHNFAFSVLEADASNDEYVRTLATSPIYAEHSLPIEIRREIAASVLRKFKRRDLETRSLIVLEYLRVVATEVQVARIYRAMLGKVSPQHSPQHSPTHSPAHSPMRPVRESSPLREPASRDSSPIREQSLQSPSQSPLRSPQSPARAQAHSPAHSPARSPSPTRSRFPKVASSAGPQPRLGNPPKLAPAQPRLRLKSSQPNLKLAGTVAPSMDAGRKQVLQQARLAVRARLEKEQRALNSK